MSLADLGLAEGATEADVRARWRQLAKTCHPDAGGTPEEFNRLKDSFENALKEVKWGEGISNAKIQMDALKKAMVGIKCPRCKGAGQSLVRQVGFRAVYQTCRLCKGKGKIREVSP